MSHSTLDIHLNDLIRTHHPDVSAQNIEKVLAFYRLMLDENERQNLTRLVAPLDFYQGHFLDVIELLKTGWLGETAMDLGSGVGVPGLLAAILSDQTHWILAESEKHKAEYLERTVNTLGLQGHVRVFWGRGEAFLEKNRVEAVVFRAVGPLDRVFAWLGPCSTWNNLILFKGPRWEEEWQKFEKSRYRGRVRVQDHHEYAIADRSQLKLIRLARVPRGTSEKARKKT